MSVRLQSLFVLCASCTVVFGQIVRLDTYTEEDIRKFVIPGTTRNAIIQRFGEPISVRKDPEFEDGSHPADEILHFVLRLPDPPNEERRVFSGFQVWLKEGKAVKWIASHRDVHLSR